MMKKVILITEYINPPYDEGIKKTVYNLFLELEKKYEVKVICRHGFNKKNIHILNVNRLFLSKKVKKIIKEFKPDSIIYFPFQSSTFASYIRLKILSSFCKKAKIVLIALQPKPLKDWQKIFVKKIKPEFALTPSPSLKQFWDLIHVSSQLIPLFTDLTVFKPLNHKNDKKMLRIEYKLPVDAYILSHMGHLNDGRNLRSLIPLQKEGYQVIVVGSSSTPRDAFGNKSLKEELERAGIIIIDRYIEHIEEIYQLSDLYVFPVVEKNSSIGLPLSILEARACGIPVLTTDYGSVRKFMGNDSGGVYYSKPDKFFEKLKEINNSAIQDYHNSGVTGLNNLFFKMIKDTLT